MFAQFGLTPQTATANTAFPIARRTRRTRRPAAEAGGKLVAEAKLLEEAGAALLDFTNSGPVAGAAVVKAVTIPVIGGFGGGPWLDGRVRLAHTAIGYARKMARRQNRDLCQYREGRARCLHGADRRRARRPPDQGLTMPSAIIDGIATRYEVVGSGPPLLMYAPGGFNAVVETWSTLGVYAKIKLLDHLPKHFTCILFDRRECGQSGGRVERVTWAHYVAQGKGLLDHLGIKRAHIMGGCMGCPPVAAFARRVSRHGREHGAVLAGRRRQIPHVEPPAFCRASGFRAQRRPRRRRGAGAQGRQTVRRRSARRALGLGHQAR